MSLKIPQSNQDHDLLVRIDEKVLLLFAEVNKIKENLGGQVATLNESKLDKNEAYRLVSDGEKWKDAMDKRVESIERYIYLAVGGAYVLAFVLKYLIK